jgi:hypothetical protein
LFGGYVGYEQTPVRTIQRHRIRIIAELNVQAEQNKEQQRKQEEMERELERQKRRQ